jgi:WD40 repeat protein
MALGRGPAACLVAAAVWHGSLPSAQAQDGHAIEVVPALTHSSGVNWNAVSKDGAFALTGASDSTVKLWDVATGRLVRTFQGSSGLVMYVAFMPDGKRIVTAGANGTTVDVWDIATGRLLQSLNDGSGAIFMAVPSPDGKYVLSSTTGRDAPEKTAMLWDPAAEKVVRRFGGHKDSVRTGAFSPDGRRLLTGGDDGAIKLWDAATGALIRTFTGVGPVQIVAFSPDGKRIFAGGNGSARLWDTQTGAPSHVLPGHARFVRSVAFSEDGTRILTADPDNTVRIWNAATGRLIGARRGQAKQVDSIMFAPGGRLALSASSEPTVMLRLWDIQTGELVRSFDAHTDWIDSAAFTPDGVYVLSTSRHSNLIYQWGVGSGRLVRTLAGHTGDVAWVTIAADGKRAASGSDDRTVRIWNLETGESLKVLRGHQRVVAGLSFSPDGSKIVSGSHDKTARIWDVASGRELRKIDHFGEINTVTFTPDGGSVIVTAGITPVVYEVATGRAVMPIRGHQGLVTSLVFSKDGKFIVTGSGDTTVRVWDAATGKFIKGFQEPDGDIVGVAVSPDDRLIAAGGHDRTVFLWDLASGKLVHQLRGHLDNINAVMFSPDGTRLASASADGTVKLWNPATGELLSTMAARAGREWLSIVPEGFFAASSPAAANLLTVVRGTAVYGMDQIWQSLYAPDLVREKLEGDREGEVRKAAAVASIDSVIGSGAAPRVEIVSPAPSAAQQSETVAVAVKLTDQGGGIGRVEWRVNGVTVAVTQAPPGPSVSLTQEVALDRGPNTVEAVGYNGRNLLASAAARVALTWNAPATAAKPNLHVLAIGINDYRDPGYADATGFTRFSPLTLAVSDARSFGAAIASAGQGYYGNVEVTYALDGDATIARLEAIIDTLAAKITPRDTFVLFAAAHGASEDGRFYLIPQDYRGENARSMAERGIGQERLQQWIVNRIRAKRAIILLDTCESGALVAGHTVSRLNVASSEAAIGRLHEATGRPVLTAAAAGKVAIEGYVAPDGARYGVFTAALIDALRNGDANRNGTIELSELAAHVQTMVPKLSSQFQNRETQKAKLGSRGEDFVVARRLP